MSNEVYRHMLRDVVFELAAKARGTMAVRGDEFAAGRQMGLCEAVSLIEQLATGFQIDLSTIGFEGFTAEDLLVAPK